MLKLFQLQSTVILLKPHWYSGKMCRGEVFYKLMINSESFSRPMFPGLLLSLNESGWQEGVRVGKCLSSSWNKVNKVFFPVEKSFGMENQVSSGYISQ